MSWLVRRRPTAPRGPLLLLALATSIVLTDTAATRGQTVEATGTASQAAADPPEETARQEYMGRRVARFMTYHGAGWLIRDSRNREEATDETMGQLPLEPGNVVCDLGCGNGYYTLRFAREVGPRGRVFAVDIQREMLRMLNQRAKRTQLNNIEPVLGEVDNPRLPARELDMVFLADVYHEFSHPESMLYWIRRSLKPKGVVALLEYREEDPTVPIKPLHKMSKSQILKEYQANGMKLVREYNELPWQHLMFFARDDSPLPEIEAEPWDER
jgi:ubiquinone/menaquinone biosynthesis C-methylase UbiE